ncbi:MAG: CD225/dispanin family protein [Segetibacter sp.]|nr:CD225/dispanin family protein [Segetibacter sp.]
MEQSYQQPQTPLTPQVPPKNWLVESILVTIFCCLPFGIAGIVNAANVNSKFAAGDYNGAIESSKNAAKWTKIGFWIGVGLIVLWIIMAVIFGSMVFWGADRSDVDWQ